jgi:hypothetical protein
MPPTPLIAASLACPFWQCEVIPSSTWAPLRLHLFSDEAATRRILAVASPPCNTQHCSDEASPGESPMTTVTLFLLLAFLHAQMMLAHSCRSPKNTGDLSRGLEGRSYDLSGNLSATQPLSRAHSFLSNDDFLSDQPFSPAATRTLSFPGAYPGNSEEFVERSFESQMPKSRVAGLPMFVAPTDFAARNATSSALLDTLQYEGDSEV